MINFKSRTPQKPLGLGFTESQKSLRMSVLRTELTLNLAHREKWFWIVIEIIQISNAYNSIILFKSEYRISLNTSRYFFISRPWLLVKQNEIQKEYKSTSNISPNIGRFLSVLKPKSLFNLKVNDSKNS